MGWGRGGKRVVWLPQKQHPRKRELAMEFPAEDMTCVSVMDTMGS